jgi:hypothetical protein
LFGLPRPESDGQVDCSHRRACRFKLSFVATLIQVPHGVLPSFLTRHQEDHLDHSVQWIVWQEQAADKAEALQCAEKADPRVDLEWMRIRYERDLNMR